MKNPDFSKAKQGAVIQESNKERITIRLDKDVVNYFRNEAIQNGGGAYQSMINDALKEYISSDLIGDAVRKAVEEQFSKHNAA
jgi:uncharacterized protein (DUF4415 family)